MGNRAIVRFVWGIYIFTHIMGYCMSIERIMDVEVVERYNSIYKVRSR